MGAPHLNAAAHRVQVMVSLIAGGLGGAAFFWFSLPLPWMLGSMLIVSAGAIAGIPFRRSVRLRKAMLAVMGLLLGSYFTSDTLSQLGLWSLAVLLVSIYVVLMTGISLGVFRRFGRMNVPTAYFSSMLGGLGPMTIAGEEAGGDNQLIPIAHVIRIFCVVSSVPIYLVLVRGIDLTPAPFVLSELIAIPYWRDWLTWGSCAVVGFFGARAIRLPFGEILGPMLLCATAYVLELVTVTMPSFVTIAAQVVIGTSIGTQFANLRGHHVPRAVMTSLGSTVVMLVGALVIAELMAPALKIDPLSLLLALVPGGLVEMGLIAVALNADTAFISVMHTWRFILIAITAPLLFGFFWRRLSRTGRHSAKSADNPDARSG
ncbi:MAG TPA: hypothetical protein DHW07_04260 [Gammaproteobacteria bacterium]|nr:hypothetical protein [Gammaproteobacteria bacterium]